MTEKEFDAYLHDRQRIFGERVARRRSMWRFMVFAINVFKVISRINGVVSRKITQFKKLFSRD